MPGSDPSQFLFWTLSQALLGLCEKSGGILGLRVGPFSTQCDRNGPNISKRPNYSTISKCPNFLTWRAAENKESYKISEKLQKMLKVAGSCGKLKKLQKMAKVVVQQLNCALDHHYEQYYLMTIFVSFMSPVYLSNDSTSF